METKDIINENGIEIKHNDKKWYREVFLNSKYWDKVRAVLTKEADYKCKKCGIKGYYDLQIHHLSYDNVGKETRNDLIVVCRLCHLEFHPDKKPICLNCGSRHYIHGSFCFKCRKESKERKKQINFWRKIAKNKVQIKWNGTKIKYIVWAIKKYNETNKLKIMPKDLELNEKQKAHIKNNEFKIKKKKK